MRRRVVLTGAAIGLMVMLAGCFHVGVLARTKQA